MSTYYHIECVTCADGSEDLGNRVDEHIRALAAEWPAIKAFLDLCARLPNNVDMSIDLQRPNGYAFTSFMRDHADHQLELVGEGHDNRTPLVVGGAPEVRSFDAPVPVSLPDGAWVRVRGSAIVEANFDLSLRAVAERDLTFE